MVVDTWSGMLEEVRMVLIYYKQEQDDHRVADVAIRGLKSIEPLFRLSRFVD